VRHIVLYVELRTLAWRLRSARTRPVLAYAVAISTVRSGREIATSPKPLRDIFAFGQLTEGYNLPRVRSIDVPDADLT